MNKDEIIELVTLYVHDYCSRASINNLSEQEVLLIERDDSWVLELTGLNGDKIKKKIKLPELSGNEPQNQLKIALCITVALTEYFTKVKGNASRTIKQRKASAQKAVNARWAKYRKNLQKTVDKL